MSATNMSSLVAACLVVLACASLVSAFEVTRCDHHTKSIKVVDFKVSNCPKKTGGYCEIELHKPVRFDVKFQAAKSYPGKSFYSTIELQKSTGEFETVAKINACNGLGLKCPIEAGAVNSFGNQFYMREELVSSAYRFGLTDDEGQTILCLEIPVQVVNTHVLADD